MSPWTWNITRRNGRPKKFCSTPRYYSALYTQNVWINICIPTGRNTGAFLGLRAKDGEGTSVNNVFPLSQPRPARPLCATAPHLPLPYIAALAAPPFGSLEAAPIKTTQTRFSPRFSRDPSWPRHCQAVEPSVLGSRCPTQNGSTLHPPPPPGRLRAPPADL